MFPSYGLYSIECCLGRYAKRPCDLRYWDVCAEHQPHRFNDFIRKDSASDSLTLCMPILRNLIAAVVCVCAEKKMVRTDTSRIVATMKHVERFIEIPIMKSIRDSVCLGWLSASVVNKSVSTGIERSIPEPAGITAIKSCHLAPEPTLDWQYRPALHTARNTAIVLLATFPRIELAVTLSAVLANLWHVGKPQLSRYRSMAWGVMTLRHAHFSMPEGNRAC